MALCKPIKQENGLTLNYHRILSVTNNPNSHVSVAVLSYPDSSIREDEKNGNINNPYGQTITYETEDTDAMTIEEAYAYIKSLPEFEGATDC